MNSTPDNVQPLRAWRNSQHAAIAGLIGALMDQWQARWLPGKVFDSRAHSGRGKPTFFSDRQIDVLQPQADGPWRRLRIPRQAGTNAWHFSGISALREIHQALFGTLEGWPDSADANASAVEVEADMNAEADTGIGTGTVAGAIASAGAGAGAGAGAAISTFTSAAAVSTGPAAGADVDVDVGVDVGAGTDADAYASAGTDGMIPHPPGTQVTPPSAGHCPGLLAHQLVLAAWRDWWALLAERTGQAELLPLQETASPSGAVIWSGALDISMPWGEGRLQLRLDHDVVTHLLAQCPDIPQPVAKPASEPLPPLCPDLLAALADTGFSVSVALAPVTLGLGQLLALQPGDVLTTTHPLDAPVLLALGLEPPLCTGWPGQRHGKHAVELIGASTSTSTSAA